MIPNDIDTPEKAFLKRVLLEVCEPFLFRQREKACIILWSVRAFFAFLEKRKPNKYCLGEVNFVFICRYLAWCTKCKFTMKRNSLKCWLCFHLFLWWTQRQFSVIILRFLLIRCNYVFQKVLFAQSPKLFINTDKHLITWLISLLSLLLLLLSLLSLLVLSLSLLLPYFRIRKILPSSEIPSVLGWQSSKQEYIQNKQHSGYWRRDWI